MTAEEVCGCPLTTNVFEETGEICRVAKRKCNKHFCWEKCRRAQIDMERVRQVIMIVQELSLIETISKIKESLI